MTKTADTTPIPGNNAGASAALAGYDYQLDVSILAALRILFVTKSASRMTLEPANAEDIEVELNEADPGHVQTAAQLGIGTRLIMQVKLRSGGPWSIEAFEGLISHGKRRKPAKDLLVDPDARYLLVTNADVSGVARNLLVHDFEEQPGDDHFPACLRSILPSAPDGRIAIFASLTPELLQYKIRDILTNILRVPKPRQGACTASLRDEARSRMRGTSPGVWAYNDLIGTIRSHGGFLASAAELEAFVEPTNFPEMIRQLEKKCAVVIAGSSGTGKTIAARALCYHARKRDGALDIVDVDPNSDPSSIRQLVHTGPKLFYIEDPWGQNSLRSGSKMWTEQLPRMLRHANPECQFVVTSRSDMLLGAQAVGELLPWSIELEADRYRNGPFAEIYDRRMDLLPPDLQSKALSFRSRVLCALEKPLELDLFFANIMSDRAECRNDEQWLRRLISLAHRNAVEDAVDRYLTDADKTGQSAAVWGVLAARGSFDRKQLIALLRSLRIVSVELATGLDELVETMIAARYLRQPTTSVSFSHPSVRAGFEKHIKKRWLRYESAFADVLIALTTLAPPHANWGMETAARLIDEGQRLATNIENGVLTFDVPPAAQSVVDSWLETALTDPDGDFSKLLQLASDVGSATSNASELARWLLTSVQRGGEYFNDRWKAPDFSDAWYERISNDSRSFLIADRFVRDHLAYEHGSYGIAFPIALDRIATDLGDAFLHAARSLVGAGHGPNIEAVLSGALRDLTTFKSIFEESLNDLALEHAKSAENAERWRVIVDGECDYSYAEFYTSGHYDDGFASGRIAELYIEAVRASGGWRTLAAHRRASEFGYHWARAIRDADVATPCSYDELSEMFAAARAGGHDDVAWGALRRHWHRDFREILKQALIVGIPDQSCSLAATACAMSADRTLLAEAFAKSPTCASRIGFLCDVIDARRSCSRNERRGLSTLMRALKPPYREIGWAIHRGSLGAAPLSLQCVNVLQQVAQTASPRILSQVIPLLIKAGTAPVEPIRRWLMGTTARDLAEAAANAAVAVEDDEAIALALQHPRADARTIALKFLTDRADPPFSQNLLALCTDPGYTVRRALLAALTAKPHMNHFPVLLRLTGDTRSDADPTYNEPDSFPIAREAVEAMGIYAPFSDQVSNQLVSLALNTTDRVLSSKCMRAAACHGSFTARKKIHAIFIEHEGKRLGLDALNSFVDASVIEPELLAPFTAEHVVRLHPAFAASATVIVCRHATLQAATALCERMAQSNADRLLAVLGACFLHVRDPKAAGKILDLLPPGHAARRILAVEEGPFPASILDGLGDIRRQPSVQNWLKDRIINA